MTRTPTEQFLAIERLRRTGTMLLVLGSVVLLGGLWLLTTTLDGPVAGLLVAAALIGAGIDFRLTARRRREHFDTQLVHELLNSSLTPPGPSR
jgi:hypothetical protein